MASVKLVKGLSAELSGGLRLFRDSSPVAVTLDAYNQSLVDSGIIAVVDPDAQPDAVPVSQEVVVVGHAGPIATGSTPTRQADGTWAAGITTPTVADVAAMRSMTAVSGRDYYLAEAGKSGYWRWDEADTTSADNIGTILVTTGGQRLKRTVVTGRYLPQWFGAKGDWQDDVASNVIGTGTDDHLAIQACVNAAITAKVPCMFLDGKFLVDPAAHGPIIVNPTLGAPTAEAGHPANDPVHCRPFSIEGATFNPSASRGKGTAIISRTAGTIFNVNLDAAGNAIADPSGAWNSFGAKGFSIVGKRLTATPLVTVTGIVGFKMFRTRSVIENMCAARLDYLVLQPDTDASANDNYCDLSIYRNLRFLFPTLSGLRLRKNDAGLVEGFYMEDPNSTITNGLELSFGAAIRVNDMVFHTWAVTGGGTAGGPFDVPGAYPTPAGSALILVDHAFGVTFSNLHLERCQAHAATFDLRTSGAIKIDTVATSFTGNTFLKAANTTGIDVRNWRAAEDRNATFFDFDVATNVSDFDYDDCIVLDSAGNARDITQNGNPTVRADAGNGRPTLPYTVLTDANQTIKDLGAYQLPTITADRTITLNAPKKRGQEIVLINRNTSSFAWNIGTSVPIDPSGGAVSPMPAQTTWILRADNNLAWRIVARMVAGVVNASRAITGATTLIDSDHTIRGDTTGGAFSVQLPTAVGRNGKEFLIFRGDASANLLTVTSAGGTINGAASYTGLSAQFKYVRVQSNGSNWFVVGAN